MRRIEDLKVWQKSRILVRDIYLVTRQEQFMADYHLSRQIQRSSVSVMSNIAEGFERSSTKELQRYLTIAKASCSELRSQLYVAIDIGYLDLNTFSELRDQAEEISKMLSGLKRSLKK